MANIKNPQMWNDICADGRVSVSKSLFGLRTTAVYNPTNSVLDASINEYSPADGDRMKRILESDRDNLEKAVANFRPQTVANGNYRAEVCASRDGAFLAVQLLQFIRMNYEPVTDVLIFEGADARVVKQMF